MSEWHYLAQGTASKPVSGEHLLAMLAAGTLSVSTPVCRVRGKRWSSAGLVREFEPALYPLGEPPLPAFDATLPAPRAGHRASARPWPRCLARLLDTSLFAASCGAGLALAPLPAGEAVQGLFGFVVLLAYTVVEASAIALVGTTPGRALLGIDLRTTEGTRPGFAPALSRSLAVWLRGLAAGVVPLMPITGYLAYRRVRQRGATSWDESGRFVVEHRAVGRWRFVAALLVLAVPLLLAFNTH